MWLLPLLTSLSLALFAAGDVFQNPVDIDSIRHTLALYSFSLDSKNFDGLGSVFTPDAVADYSQPIGVLHGLSEIQATLSAALARLKTQHSLTTQHIKLLGHRRANATTYVIASHFGVGVYDGQLLTAWAKYDDVLSGAQDGSWKISNRRVTFMVPAKPSSGGPPFDRLTTVF
jgi:ketosteroid isomerase-like protein